MNEPLFLTTDEFFAVYGREESGSLEFKESLVKTAKLQDPVVAFANARGGRILIGVRGGPPPTIIGVTWDQALEERIQEVARITHPHVELVPQRIQVGDLVVAMIEVAAVERGWVQTSDGRLIVRAGPTNRTLLGDELARFLRERSDRPIEDSIVAGVDIDALDLAALQAYLTTRLRRERVNIERTARELGLLDPDGHVKLATLLLFGHAPQTTSRRFGIDVVRFDGVLGERTAIRNRTQLTGTLSDLVQQADRAIYDEMRRDSVIRGLIREEVPEYPTVALREALVNAVGHRDYSLTGSAVEVRIYDDGLEIESPGALAGYVTVENLRDAQYSRNVRIMDTLGRLGLVEEAGTGIDRIYEALDDALLVPPEFEERDGSFVVRFRGQTIFSAEDRLWVARFADRIPNGHGRVALVYVRRHGAIRNEDLRDLRHLDAPTSRAILADLVERGLLTQLGTRRGTRYVLGDLAVDSQPVDEVSAKLDVITAHARRVGSITNSDVRGLLNLDRTEALRLLELAVTRGTLRPIGERRARRYLPPQSPGER